MLEVAVVAEDRVGVEDRAAVLGIFPDGWRAFPDAATCACTQRRPGWRAVAREDGEIVGQLGLVPLAPGVVGISDWVVGQSARRRGVATALGEAAVAWGDAEGLALLVDTLDDGLRRLLARLGFRPVVAAEAVLEDRDGRRVPPGWMARGEVRGVVLDGGF